MEENSEIKSFYNSRICFYVDNRYYMKTYPRIVASPVLSGIPFSLQEALHQLFYFI